MARLTDATGGGQPQQTATRLNAQDAQPQPGGDSVLVLPHPDYVANAAILRDGPDLILRHPDGGSVVVEGYFTAHPVPTLTSDTGASLTPALVRSFVTSAHAQYAQAGDSQTDESAVGVVSEATGHVTVTRADGTTETVGVGTAIFAGDIVETDAAGAVNIMFIDETSFAVSNNARLAIDEYVFDPATAKGTTQFSVLRGMFVFVSGMIGREDPDDVEIATPVGSIGIRGTTIAGNVDTGEIMVMEGAIVLRSLDGRSEITLATQFESARFTPGGTIEPLGVKDAADVNARFAALQAVMPGFFATLSDTPQSGNDNAPQQSAPEPTPAPQPAAPPPGGYNETKFDGGNDAGFTESARAPAPTTTTTSTVTTTTTATNTAPLAGTETTARDTTINNPPPTRDASTDSNTGTGTGTGTTTPPAPVAINITANGTYTGGGADDTFTLLTMNYGTIIGGAGYDRIVADTTLGGTLLFSPGNISSIEEISTVNGQNNNISLTYDRTMTQDNDSRHLLIEMEAGDTLNLNFQGLGFYMSGIEPGALTFTDGTHTVRVETPNVSSVNVQGLDMLAIGDVMTNGSVFAGYTQNGTMMFLSTFSSPLHSWNDGAASGYTLVLGTTINDGAANTALLAIEDSNITAGFQTHNAALYAQDLVAHGWMDWYLPSINELVGLYYHKDSLALSGSLYWSSTHGATDSLARAVDFNTGQTQEMTKDQNLQTLAIRQQDGPTFDNLITGTGGVDTITVLTDHRYVNLLAGNDTLAVQTGNVSNSYFNGGAGYDRLLSQTTDLLDLSAMGNSNVQSFEEIGFDLAGSQTIRISLQQIFQLMKQSESSNTLVISNVSGTTDKTLEIVGAGDSVTLDATNTGAAGSFSQYLYDFNGTIHTLQIHDTINLVA